MPTSQQKKVLSEISIRDGFRYFSGFDEPLNGVHTAMYVFGEKQLMVVGVNSKGCIVEQEFEDMESALRTFVLMQLDRDDVSIALERHRQRENRT